jgi:PadR family transcriptional regulator
MVNVMKLLGDFEVLVLLSLVRLKDLAYGATIHREIEKKTGRSVAIGAVYTGLARLQRSGYIRASIGEPTRERGGRRKKFYHLEPRGALALTRSLEARRRLMDGIEPELAALMGQSRSRRRPRS